MCGIAGVVVGDGRTPVGEVERMLDHLVHRGPDARGVHGGPGGAVGQTRLAVIDLTTGDPPIAGEDGLVGAALNGEIYNFRALRTELRAAGHRLTTVGDTEVLAHLGESLAAVELARRLDGMFAAAVWDGRPGRSRLTLVRDRLGKKPLYYWSGPGTFVFGSEIKAVLAHPAVPRRLAAEAIPAYLAFGYVPTPRTFFEGVRSLPPGHVLTVSPGAEPVVEQYWKPPVAGLDGVSTVDLSFDEAAAEVRQLLTRAVERRLVADVPIGAFLSGGVDSSALVGVMAGLVGTPVSTFTIGFEVGGYDERPFARQVAERFGTDHTEFVVRPDATELLERVLWHHDQPFGDSSALPTYLLAELTRKEVTVALSGDGADEVFAGYERFPAALARGRLDRVPAVVRRAMGAVAGRMPPDAFRGRARSVQRLVGRPDLDALRAYLEWVGFVPDEWRGRLAGPVAGRGGWWWDDYVEVWQSSAGAAPLARLLDLNLRTYLLDDLLPKVDRMSMAHALEVRSPFLDVDLVEFVARLPLAMKLRGFDRKRVLKAAVADLLPGALLNRRKRGFGVPVGKWFQEDLAPWVDDLLCSSSSRCRHHLDAAAIDAYVADHRRSGTHGHGLWALVALETFLRREGW